MKDALARLVAAVDQINKHRVIKRGAERAYCAIHDRYVDDVGRCHALDELVDAANVGRLALDAAQAALDVEGQCSMYSCTTTYHAPHCPVAQAALGAGERVCANPEQHRCADYHRQEDEIADLRARLAACERELDEAETREADIGQLLERVTDENTELRERFGFTYCAFCGAQTALDAPDKTEEITAHVLRCEAHPMRQAEQRARALAAAVEKYGRHEGECQRADNDCQPTCTRHVCTCGFDATKGEHHG